MVDKLPPNPFLSKRGGWLTMQVSKQKASVPYMDFSEKLMTLRKQAGLSQEQLADRLGVTRQSVSKWESGAAFPELVKIISLSEMFGVSVDYLVKDYLEEPEQIVEEGMDTARLEQKVDDLTRYVKGSFYAYDSQTRIFGLPLVSIRVRFVRRQQMRWENVARGVFAIGNVAIGVVSLGLVSVGLLSFGCIALGLLTLGVIAMGLVSLGVVALGLLAFGVCAIGLYAGGVCAVGSKIAVGVASAAGETAVGYDADAANILLWGSGLSRGEVEAFLRAHHPTLWPPLLRFFSELGAHIK